MKAHQQAEATLGSSGQGRTICHTAGGSLWLNVTTVRGCALPLHRFMGLCCLFRVGLLPGWKNETS